MGLQLLVLQLFVTVVAAVYLAAAACVSWIAAERLFGKPPPGRRARRVRGVILGLAGAGTACIAYGYFVEPYRPQVTHTQVRTAKLHHPVRVVHLSDLHCDPRPRLEPRLPDLVAAEHPDLIVFTGDALNNPRGLPLFRETMQKLAVLAPTFGVAGNWDSWYWKDLHVLQDTGVRELDGDVATLEVQGETLTLGGVAVEHEKQIEDVLRQLGPGFSVFLYHYPDEVERVSGHADLYCAGHTHGGQVALPFYGALITLSRYGKRFEAGLYQVGTTALYVSRGIGMEGGAAPRVRFWAPPEITVIDLVPR